MALIAAGLVIVRMAQEIVPLRNEVRELRNLVGRLTVDDPTRLHAVRAQSVEPDFWRWRIHVPQSPTYYLHNQPYKVPREGIPPRPNPRGGTPLQPGELFLELRIAPHSDNPPELMARFKWHGGGNVGQSEVILRERDQKWIKNEIDGKRTDGWPNTLLKTESVDQNEPLVLLRLRANDLYITSRDPSGRVTGSGIRVFDIPCDGLIVWIDTVEH